MSNQQVAATKTNNASNKKIQINRSDLQSDFVTPPEEGGQIVSSAYACTEDYIVESIHDASDRTTVYFAYKHPRNGGFEPWNGTPKLGRKLGRAKLI